MGKAILLTISDLVADQRVHRTATTLQNSGFEVLVVGRRLPNTPKKISSAYRIKHLRIPFRNGFLFYAFYNIVAFLFLIFNRYQIVQANDLDTLLAARLACVIKRKPLVYDSHELFTEVPELINRPKVKSFWGWVEKNLVRGLKHCSTVSVGVARELEGRYGVKFNIIRNLPFRKAMPNEYNPESRTIIYQGALNVGRGLEKLISSMQFISKSKLIIVGSGDIEDKLIKLSKKFGVDDRVIFMGRISHSNLHAITCTATIGVSVEEDMGLNYRYALPNKLFDYIQAGLPVVVSNLPEMKSVIDKYNVGLVVPFDCDEKYLAEKINIAFDNQTQLYQWHNNTKEAAKELIWENEEKLILELFSNALQKNA